MKIGEEIFNYGIEEDRSGNLEIFLKEENIEMDELFCPVGHKMHGPLPSFEEAFSKAEEIAGEKLVVNSWVLARKDS